MEKKINDTKPIPQGGPLAQTLEDMKQVEPHK